jgi:hypothetical protein
LYDPAIPPRTGLTKEAYMGSREKNEDTTVNHFYEKLLLLRVSHATCKGQICGNVTGLGVDGSL